MRALTTSLLYHYDLLCVLPVPDGDHFSVYDSTVQLLHAADVSRPLELLRIDEENGLLDPRKDLVI